MKLKKILLGLLLIFTMTAVADNYSYLTIEDNNGETSLSLNEIRKITFDADNMIVTATNGESTLFPLATLNKMFFAETGATGIFASKKDGSQVRLVDGTIHVNAPAGSVVTLYNMNGQTIKSVTTAGSDTQMNVSGLTKGVYIVKVGQQTKKIMNR